MYKIKIVTVGVLEIISLEFSLVVNLLQREMTQPTLQHLWVSAKWLVSIGESLNVAVNPPPNKIRIIKQIATDFISFHNEIVFSKLYIF